MGKKIIKKLSDMPKPKLKKGRPTVYDPKFKETVLDLMMIGASLGEVCLELNISRQCFAEWREKYKDFGETVKKGVELSESWWTMQGRINIYNKQFNAVLWYMNMKNRFGWKDNTDNKVTLHVKHEDALQQLE